MKRPLKPGVFGAAQFETVDGARVARLRLDRWWDETLVVGEHGRPADERYRPLVVIGMNPSDADDKEDDNTIDKVITFAKREGANGLVMVNPHPGIATKPRDLCNVLLPPGCDERNWEAVRSALREDAVAFIAGWGKGPPRLASWTDRVAKVRALAADAGRKLVCFGMNGDGSPKHPLYLPGDTPLVPWSPR